MAGFLDLGPGPLPKSPPPTPPAPPAVAPAASALGGAMALVAALAIGIGGTAWWMHRAPGPAPVPTTDAVKLGRDFRGPLAKALAKGFRDAAAAIHAGKPMADVDAALKQSFSDARNQAFAAGPAPAFAAVVPEKAEPKDDATRAAFEKLHADFATGLEATVK